MAENWGGEWKRPSGPQTLDMTSQRRAVYRRRFMLEGAAARWRLSKHFSPEPMWLLRYSLALGLLALVLLVVG